jgi:FtsP/CotA-like multicopper oxidase with cupredoxin domain
MRLPKRRTVLIVLAAVLGVVLVAVVTLNVLARASLWPEAIYMGSDHHGQHHQPGTGTTSVTDLKLGPTDAPLRSYTLTAEVVKRPGLSDAWAYNGSVPGPEIRVKQGDHVHVTLVNRLPVPTSLHWHGINVPNVADGPAGVTQDAVKPGASYDYDFIASETGTYWYHSHQRPSEQISRGLLGALIVEPKQAPRYDREYTVIYHDRTVPSRTFGAILSKIRGNRDHDAISVNNTNRDLALHGEPGELVRLRIINGTAGEATAYGDPLRIVPLGAAYTVVALDGHDVNGPTEITSQILPIGSGQRYDLVFKLPPSGGVRLVDKDQSETVTIGGPTEAAVPDLAKLPVFDITTYGRPAADRITAGSKFDATYDIVLGSKPGFINGEFGLLHTINDKTFPDVPMITVRRGQLVKLHLVNKAADEYHPLHLHGHFFTVLAKNGQPLKGSPIHLDSLLVGPDEQWDVAFVADNPGLWMLHCHVLIHAVTGMDMMVVYPDISTPFTVGSKSDNFPD